jgi:enoyl-CoA hydratase/carnithine racemase
LPSVEYYLDAAVSVISLNDQENGNRLNLEFLKSLLDAFKRSQQEPGSKAVLIRSTAEPFCLGMDFEKLLSRRREEVVKAIETYRDLLASIYDSPKPVIIILDGDVKAGGVGLVCAGDIVLSTHRTSFELSEVLFGIIPANVLPYLLTLRVSPQKARYLVLTSKRIFAEEALRLGLVDELFTQEKFEQGVRAVIKKLLRSSPSALAETKAFTAGLLGKDLEAARKMALEEFLRFTSRPAVLDAMRAFNSGSLPEWFGSYKPGKSLTFTDE